MTFVILTAIGAIAGLIVGYVSGRYARPLIIFGIWAATAVAVGLYAVWLDSGQEAPDALSIVALYALAIPFALCLVGSSLLGAMVRAYVARNAP